MMTNPLHNYLGFRILQVHKAHRNRAEAALNQLGLHTGQEMVLFQLWEEESLTQSQLAEKLCVGAATITKSLQRLEQGGFVERRQDAEDARISRVYLTPQGRALKEPVQKVWEDLETLTVQSLTEVEKALLGQLLDQMNANLNK